MVISEYKYFRKIGYHRAKALKNAIEMLEIRLRGVLTNFIERFKKQDEVTNDDYGV